MGCDYLLSRLGELSPPTFEALRRQRQNPYGILGIPQEEVIGQFSPAYVDVRAGQNYARASRECGVALFVALFLSRLLAAKFCDLLD